MIYQRYYTHLTLVNIEKDKPNLLSSWPQPFFRLSIFTFNLLNALSISIFVQSYYRLEHMRLCVAASLFHLVMQLVKRYQGSVATYSSATEFHLGSTIGPS